MRISAVSGGKDWAAYGEKSVAIDVVENLSDALEKLQNCAEQAEVTIRNLLVDIESGNNAHLAGEFERLLSDGVSGANVHAEADSAYHVEGEDVYLELERFEFDGFQSQVVQAGPAIIVASIDLRVNVTAHATFSLSVYDSIDKDYVGISTTTVSKGDEECDVRVLLTFEGDFETGQIELTKLELIGGLSEIDFGHVEPDYSESDYDDLGGSEEEPSGAPEAAIEDER